MKNPERSAGLEQHLGGILESHKKIIENYRFHLLQIYGSIKKYPYIRVDEGDYYIRFNTNTDLLNRLFFLYEIGEIARTVLWRALLRSSIGLTFFLLHAKATFLPAYSYSLDRPFTFVYWGEKQFLFNPEQLKKLKLRSFVVGVDTPSNVDVSLANLVWPKSVSKIYGRKSGLEDISKNYLYNALFPPKLSPNFLDIWSESPFVIIGNNAVDIFTIHKTICAFTSSRAKKIEKDIIQTKIKILDSNLTMKETQVCVSPQSLDQIKKDTITGVIASKHFRIYKTGHPKKASLRLSIFPFESTEIFRNEIPELIATVASIVLRSLYFRSGNLLTLKSGFSKFHDEMMQVFRHRTFNKYRWETLGSRLLKTDEGLQILLRLLNVYHHKENSILFIHPCLIECFSSLYEKEDDLDVNELRTAAINLATFLETQPLADGINSIFRIQELFEKEMGMRLGFKTARNILRALQIAKHTTIPLSKELNNPYYENSLKIGKDIKS